MIADNKSGHLLTENISRLSKERARQSNTGVNGVTIYYF